MFRLDDNPVAALHLDLKPAAGQDYLVYRDTWTPRVLSGHFDRSDAARPNFRWSGGGRQSQHEFAGSPVERQLQERRVV